MATSGNQSLGDDLQALGKAFNACEKINEIGTVIRKANEDLKSVRNSADNINVTLASLRQFRETLDDCIGIADSLNGHIEDIAQEHSSCEKDLKKIANAGKLSNEDVKSITDSLSKLLESFNKFGVSLGTFIKRIKELQTTTERVKDEATREEEKVRKEASSTRSEAKWKSFWQWTARIGTVGLITLSSGFQSSVKANNEKYERADELEKIFEKFKKARQQLDMAVQMIDKVGDKVGDRPKELTKEVIQIIQSVLLQYQKLDEAHKQVLVRDEKLKEKDDENESLKRQVEELMRKQELKAQKDENESLKRQNQDDSVLNAQKDETEQLKKQLEDLTRNKELKAQKDENECLKRQLDELRKNQELKDQKEENERLKMQLEELKRKQELTAQKDENERLKRQLEELTRNEEGSPAT